MTEADAEQRHPLFSKANENEAAARLLGTAGARREDDERLAFQRRLERAGGIDAVPEHSRPAM